MKEVRILGAGANLDPMVAPVPFEMAQRSLGTARRIATLARLDVEGSRVAAERDRHGDRLPRLHIVERDDDVLTSSRETQLNVAREVTAQLEPA